MDGVERACTHQFKSFVKIQSAFNVVNQTLHVAQGGMTFIEVVNVFRDAQLLQSQNTADTEQIFLLQTVFPISAIEGVGDVAVVLRVEVVVCVEQIEADAAHVGTPNGCMNLIVWEGHINDDLVAIFIEHTLNWQTVEILGIVVGNLLAVHRERLGEITIAIQETNGTHVDIAV